MADPPVDSLSGGLPPEGAADLAHPPAASRSLRPHHRPGPEPQQARMRVRCSHCPLRKCDLFVPFSAEDLAFMERFKSGELEVAAGTTILMEGSNSPQLYTVLRGLGTRYKTLENGRRQVINFLFPGDFIGLQAGLMGEMKHSVETSTRMTLCVFNRSDLWTLFNNFPERAYDLTWLAAVEEHFLGEAVATLGQRDASQRLAWALVRIYLRLRAVGMGTSGAVPLPFRQQDLADALGLSLVHTNKTLARFRALQFLRWSGGELKIDNLAALTRLGMVDPDDVVKRPIM
jgi:CRP/FNR family transcriptional regulator, anaerobic regulatory protein